MSKVVHVKNTLNLIVATDQEVARIDVTNCNGVSAQLNGIAGTAGSMKLQQSNDNTNWVDIPSATATLAPTAANIISVPNIYTGHVRLLATLSGGAGEYNAFLLGKEH